MQRSKKLLVTDRFLEECEGLEGEAAARLLRALGGLLRADDEGVGSGEGYREQPVGPGTRIVYTRSREVVQVLTLAPDSAARRPGATAPFEPESSRRYELDTRELHEVLRSPASRRPGWRILGALLRLDPDQQRLVGLPAEGHLLIRGGAGTGKSTLAFRRALNLARQELLHGPPSVLLLAGTRVQRELWSRALPTVAAEAAPAIHVDTAARWCQGFLEEHCPELRPMSPESFRGLVEEALRLTRQNHGGATLERAADFFVDELEQVILAHGIGRREDYRRLLREGRRLPLDASSRDQVFLVYRAFEELREAHGGVPPALLADRVVEALEGRPGRRYDHVLVDEAHTLTPGQLRVCIALARGGSLTLFTDAEVPYWFPRVRWRNLGLDFTGRTHHLTTHRRSNRQILEAAERVLHPHGRPATRQEPAPEDLEALPFPPVVPAAPPAGSAPASEGLPPQLVRCRDWRGELAALVRIVRRKLRAGERPGTIAVLARHRHYLERVATRFEERNIPHLRPAAELDPVRLLEDDAVRLVPLDQVAGLEFPVVILADVNQGVFPQERSGRPSAEDQRMDLEESRRAIYLAMTRAIRELWLVGTASRCSPLLPEQGLAIHRDAANE
jgi:hypothetical protein